MQTVLEQLDYAGSLFTRFALPMLAESAVLILVLFAVDLAVRGRIRASFRYLLWMLAPIRLVLPPFLPLPARLETLLSAQADYLAGAVGRAGAQTITLPATALTWRAILATAWLFVAATMTVCWVRRAVRQSRIRARAREGNSLMRGVLWYCRTCIGVKEQVRLKLSSETSKPAVNGFLRPTVLVPHQPGPSLGSRHLRCVLLHELAYIKRLDIWVEFAQKLLQVIYFYNPLLWAANHMIRKTRDEAVDEMVVAIMGDKAQWYRQMRINVSNLSREKGTGNLRTGRSVDRRVVSAPRSTTFREKTRRLVKLSNCVACLIMTAAITASL